MTNDTSDITNHETPGRDTPDRDTTNLDRAAGTAATAFANTVELARISDYPAHFAAVTPDADAVVDVGVDVGVDAAGSSVSYADFERRIDAVARGLLACGVRRGDRVAMLATPCTEHLVHFMAAGRIGAAWVGLNPRYTADELGVVLRDATPKVVVAMLAIEGREYAAELAALRDHDVPDAVLVAATGSAPGFVTWDELVARAIEVGDAELAAAADAVTADDVALVVYTSGTTGTPKGAMLSHRSVVATARIQCEHWWAEPFRILNNLPINHIGGAVQLACHALVAGGANVVMPRFDPVAMPAVIRERRVTVIHQVPTMYQLLLERGGPTPDDLASLQVLIWSGAAAPRPLIGELRAFCPRLHTSFGQTETGGEVLYSPAGSDDDELAAFVGVPDPRIAVRLDPDTGELQVRGDTVMSGYLGRPVETEQAFTPDGWLCTGDLAEVDARGRFRIVGRLREMFKSGGYNVYPREIEIVLESHPAVAVAAVVGVRDDIYGEVGHAWIVARDGHPGAADLDAASLAEHCRRHLANYKVPKAFHVRAELPMLPIGKVDKAKLRAGTA